MLLLPHLSIVRLAIKSSGYFACAPFSSCLWKARAEVVISLRQCTRGNRSLHYANETEATVHYITKMHKRRRGQFIYKSLPVFIPVYIEIILEDPSLVKWSPLLIISAAFTQSKKSLSLIPRIECRLQNGIIIL